MEETTDRELYCLLCGNVMQVPAGNPRPSQCSKCGRTIGLEDRASDPRQDDEISIHCVSCGWEGTISRAAWESVEFRRCPKCGDRNYMRHGPKGTA